jgi:CBS domain-containing protein
MSPRAAWRLEALGFTRVYDYVTGKVDWRAAGLPTIGSAVQGRILEVIERDVPTCGPAEEVGPAIRRAHVSGWDISVVLNEERIVQGRLRLDKLGSDPEGTVGDLMEPGPATIRADANIVEMRQRMADRHVSSLIVSTPEGRLLGAIRPV